MAGVQVFWDPSGFQLDALTDTNLVRLSDGDTPVVEMSIRMLSIDTPETRYESGTDVAVHDQPLQELGVLLQQGTLPVPIDVGLAQHLIPRLDDGQAGSRQLAQGTQAKQSLDTTVTARITRPNGTKRKLFLHTANGSPFDQYGRLLAYVAPNYTANERATMTPLQRATFNLLMVESGWAAPFPIFPSLPKFSDLVLFHTAAVDAHTNSRGIWAEPRVLTGYEFRMCVKLSQLVRKIATGVSVSAAERRGWIDRYCADMTTLKIYQPEEYYRVSPPNRLFIWPQDVNAAVAQLNLLPG